MKRVRVKRSDILRKITEEYMACANKVSELPENPEFVFYKWNPKKICYEERRTTRKDVLNSFFMFSPTLQKTTLDGNPYILPS